MQTTEAPPPVAAGGWLRSLAWLPALVIAVGQSYAALSRPSTDWLADLRVYRGAVIGLRHHHSLYDFITANDAPFTYPPFAGLIMAPLAYAAERPVGVAWTVGTVVLVGLMAWIVARAAEVPARLRPWLAPLTAAVLFASAPVSSNLRFGQVSIALATLVLVDALIMDGRRGQGILIGIAAAIKLTPLIFIPMLWLGGRKRAAYIATGTFAAAIAAAWFALPGDSRSFWSNDLAQVNRLGHISTGGNQAFNGAMLRWSIDDHVRSVLMFAVAAIVGGVALMRARRAYRGRSPLTAVVIVGAASVVISPVSWTHHQVWLVLAALLPVRGGRGWQITVSALTVAIMVIPLASISPIFTDAHLVLAILIACLIPYRTGRAPSTNAATAPVDVPTGIAVAG